MVLAAAVLGVLHLYLCILVAAVLDMLHRVAATLCLSEGTATSAAHNNAKGAEETALIAFLACHTSQVA